MLRRLAAVAAFALAATAAGAEDLPTPAGLEPAVRFWTRIYTEVDSHSGLIHDAETLAVVYETLRFPKGLSHRAREQQTERAKRRLRGALLSLAKGKRSGLSGDEARVLAQWPEGVSDTTLRQAADRLRFQLGLADRFREGLVRSGEWRAFVQQTLASRGVPAELVALPHVESSYNPKAYSRVGAAGMWQFTRSTGKLFMRIDNVIDERLDPYIATEAAARLLAKNREITGTWPLAITGYNHGAAGMRRAARTLGTTDMGEIVRRYKSRTFGFASRNFYVSFLAASRIDRDPSRYFGTVRQNPPIAFTEVELPWFTPARSLASALGVDLGVLREHNPALRPAVWTGNKHVPSRYRLRVPRDAVTGPIDTLIAKIPGSDRLAQQDRDQFHKVGRGETLSRIASRYGVSEHQLVELNNLRNRHQIRVGQVLVLPDRAGAGRVAVAQQPPPSDGVYRVQHGDTLSKIAERFGTSERALASENGIRNRHQIAVGQRLRVPGAAPAVVASAGPSPASAKVAPAEPVGAATAAPAEPPALALAAPQPEPPAPAADPEPEATLPKPEPEPEATLPESEPAREAMLPGPPAELPAQPEAETAVGVADEPPPPPPAAIGEPGSQRDDPSDYAVHGNRITVQAAETLGHFAEWLEVRASQLRQLNRMRYEQPVVIGQRLALDFSRVSPTEFEQRRLEYHQSLQNEFFQAFVVTGTERHVLAPGESLWYLAKRKYQVPVWLLRQYNPDLDFSALPAGSPLIVPVVEPRST